MNNSDIDLLIKNFYISYTEVEKLFFIQCKNGLTIKEMRIINIIGEESLSMKDLSLKLGISVSTCTAAVSKLERKGVAERKSSETDRRITTVTLTDRGKRAKNEYRKSHKEMVERYMYGIGDEEVEGFYTTFQKILKNIKGKNLNLTVNTLNNFLEGSKVKILRIHGKVLKKENFFLEGSEGILVGKGNDEVRVLVDHKIIRFNLSESKKIIGFGVRN